MTIRDIAIAIGFDVDEAALKKVFERLNNLKDKTVKVQAQTSADDLSARQVAEEQSAEALREQSQATQEILQNEQRIAQQTKQTVRSSLSLRSVLQKIFQINRQNTTETGNESKKKNVLLSVAGKVLEKVRAIGKAIKGQAEETDRVTNSYQEMMGKVKSLVATLGLGFSLVQLKQISEEFNGINDRIRDSTRGMGEQSELQQQILKAANESRTSYGDTAKFVSNLVRENSELFGTVEQAAQYAELTSKLFKAAGKSNEETAALQEAINKSFAKGKVDSETISQLLEEAPEAVKLLEKELGVTKECFEDMASEGQISLSALKNSIINNADTINASFNELDLNLSDALLNIRNQWGLWVDKINSQYGATKKLSYFLINFFSKLISWLDKGIQMIDKLADKVGGMENLLKLIAMAAGSIWLALNASKILTFFKSLSGLLTLANLKTLALVAVILLIALAIDDLIHFLNGDASVIGEFFEQMGIDADDARETISKVIQTAIQLAKTVGKVVWEVIKWLAEVVGAVVEGITAAIGAIGDLIDSIKEKWEWLKGTPLGKFAGWAGEKIGEGMDWLQDAADKLTQNGTVATAARAETVAASAGVGGSTNNITIKNDIQNTFNGSDREMQQKGAEMMGKAADDSFDEAARGLATGY